MIFSPFAHSTLLFISFHFTWDYFGLLCLRDYLSASVFFFIAWFPSEWMLLYFDFRSTCCFYTYIFFIFFNFFFLLLLLYFFSHSECRLSFSSKGNINYIAFFRVRRAQQKYTYSIQYTHIKFITICFNGNKSYNALTKPHSRSTHSSRREKEEKRNREERQKMAKKKQTHTDIQKNCETYKIHGEEEWNSAFGVLYFGIAFVRWWKRQSASHATTHTHSHSLTPKEQTKQRKMIMNDVSALIQFRKLNIA